MDPWTLFALITCVIFSAFFSSAETALASLSPATIERLIQENRVSTLKLWRDNPVRTLITILIGNNVVNVAAASFATVVAEEVFQSSGLAVAIGSMTLIILVMGEITPKSLARLYAVKLTPLAMPLIALFYYLFLPASTLLQLLVNTFLAREDADQLFTEKDLLYYITLASHGGKIPKERAEMLSSIVILKDVQVREVMVPRPKVVLLNLKEGIAGAKRIFKDHGFSRIPVYRDQEDEIIGILHVKDTLLVTTEKLEDLLNPVHYVPETKRVLHLLKEMQRERLHFTLIVDEYGTFVGIVTLEDILEEIVGEIEDEHDPLIASTTFIKLPDGSYEIDGALSLHEVNRRLKSDFPITGDYETLAGFVIAESGKLPETGQKMVWKNWELQVVGADEKKVSRIRVRPSLPGEERES